MKLLSLVAIFTFSLSSFALDSSHFLGVQKGSHQEKRFMGVAHTRNLCKVLITRSPEEYSVLIEKLEKQKVIASLTFKINDDHETIVHEDKHGRFIKATSEKRSAHGTRVISLNIEKQPGLIPQISIKESLIESDGTSFSGEELSCIVIQ